MLTSPPDGFLDDLGRLAGPDEGRRVLVPAVDVPLDVGHEGPDRVEGAPANGLTSQNAEPDLHHVQPRRPRRREVEVDARVSRQPRLDLWGFVRGRVVEDDMQGARPIPSSEDVQEPKEVGSGVARAARADDGPGCDVQRRVQTGQPIALVVMSLAGRKAWSEWQDLLRPVQRLGCGSSRRRSGRRRWPAGSSRADHIVDLHFGVGIRAELKRLDPMGRQGVRLPDPVDRAVRHADLGGEFAGAPMRQDIPRRLQRHGHHLRPLAGGDGRRTSRARLVRETREPFFSEEPSPEATDLDHRIPSQPSHLCTRDLASQQEHHASSTAEAGRHSGGALQSFECGTVGFPQHNRTGMIGHDPSRDRVDLEGI